MESKRELSEGHYTSTSSRMREEVRANRKRGKANNIGRKETIRGAT